MSKKVSLFYRKRISGFNSIEEIFDGLHSQMAKKINVEKVEAPHATLSLRAVISNLKFLRNNKSQINHITGHINYAALVTGRNTLLTVHDIKSTFSNNIIKNLFLMIFLYWLPALIVRYITVISNQTKDEVIKYVPFAKHKIKVIHNPINPALSFVQKDFNASCPKILCVGTKENKNLESIFKAIDGLPCELIVIGVLSKTQKELISKYNISSKNYYDLNYLEVIEKYIECDILCFPSTYEGFGMPIIEAQAVGRPVITSNFGAMREVASDSACLVDPFSIAEIRNGLEHIIDNAEYRNCLIESGLKNIKRFHQDVIVHEYLSVYKLIDEQIK